MSALFAIVLSLLAIFLILIVLVQRGRGGGLAGALGGMGGSSAFGAKAGDVFTRITIVTAAIWIVVCVAAFYWAGHRGDALGSSEREGVQSPLDTAPMQGGQGNDFAAPLPTAAGPRDAAPPTGTPSESAPPAASDAPASSPPAESAPADGK